MIKMSVWCDPNACMCIGLSTGLEYIMLDYLFIPTLLYEEIIHDMWKIGHKDEGNLTW